MEDKIIIAYVCDRNYINFLKKSIESVKRYNKNVEFVALSREELNIPGLTTYVIDPDSSKFKFKKNDRMTEGTYWKFFLPILPYDKILYIDCDVICQRPLNELWNIDCPFICATESHNFGKKQAARMGIKKYAIAGMMLMNLKVLREENYTQRCLDTLAKLNNVEQHDETILNTTFNNRIKFIDVKYNYCRNRKYDNPINEEDAYILHYVGNKLEKEEMLKLDNFSGLENLKPFFKDKTIAIVGNAQSILGTNKGKEIDSHDIVIRINKGFPNKDHNALGYKTDILFLCATLTNKELQIFNPKYTVRRSKLCKNICDFNVSAEDRRRLVQEPNKLRKVQAPGSKSQPSTGFVAINFALSTECKNIDLYGFDFFKTPTYYNPVGYQTLHNGDKEFEKVLEYEKWGLLKIH